MTTTEITLTTTASVKRRGVLRTALLLACYLGILVLAVRAVDFTKFTAALRALQSHEIVAVLAVIGTHLGMRALRFHELARKTRPSNYNVGKSISIFLVGVGASALTPGRMGDLIKGELLHKFGVRRATGLGLVFIERVMDLVAILGSLCVSGILLTRQTQLTEITLLGAVALLGLLVGVTLLSVKRLRIAAVRLASSALTRVIPKARRFVEPVERLFDVWDIVLAKPRILLGFALTSCVLWCVDFVKLWALLSFMGSPRELLIVLFIYPASLVAGILTLLPFSEGIVGLAAVAMLTQLANVDVNTATAVVLVDRGLSTLTPIALYGVLRSFGITERFPKTASATSTQ